MQLIDTVTIPCEVIEVGNCRFVGTIKEIGYNTNGDPYMITVEWNGRTKKFCPKFEDDCMKVVINKHPAEIHLLDT